MPGNDILEYRLDQLDRIISQCSTNYSGIYNNLKSIEECLDVMRERIDGLESDLRERKLRKYIFNTMIFFYPIIIAIMMFFQSVDHKNLVATMENIEGWIGFSLQG